MNVITAPTRRKKHRKMTERDIKLDQFKVQIEEDMDRIITDWGVEYPVLKRKEYCFNYWVLDKIYNEEERYIPGQITDRNDKCIDCYTYFVS